MDEDVVGALPSSLISPVPLLSLSASEMTYIVSSGALNSTHSLTPLLSPHIRRVLANDSGRARTTSSTTAFSIICSSLTARERRQLWRTPKIEGGTRFTIPLHPHHSPQAILTSSSPPVPSKAVRVPATCVPVPSPFPQLRKS